MAARIQNLEKLDGLIEPMLRAANIPGAAIAIVVGGETVFAKGYGYRDVDARLPATSATIYPIASTTKAINATLIGMLVDEKKLAWDAPVQEYLPRFQLWDPALSAQVTLRDLLAMRTGLASHNWLWIDNPISRADLVERLRYLAPVSGFRQKFEYSNLTTTAAGHIAEIVTGKPWEDLLRQRILEPLRMTSTGFALPPSGPATMSYYEDSHRKLRASRRLASEVSAPSGGSVHSTVEDMARWMVFNLSGGQVDGGQLIQPQTLAEIQSPQVIGIDRLCPGSHPAYAMGWFVDTYNGAARLEHGGYIHEVNSEVMLFPDDDLGIVSFNNFGFSALAKLLHEHVFDSIKGLDPARALDGYLEQIEAIKKENRERIASVRRVENTTPSHSSSDYAGSYMHPGYGRIEVLQMGQELFFKRNDLVVSLRHWHYDSWVPGDCEEGYLPIAQAFDGACRFAFDTDADGEISGVSIRLEPAVAPIRFEKTAADSETLSS